MSDSVNQLLPAVDGTHALVCSNAKVLRDSMAAPVKALRQRFGYQHDLRAESGPATAQKPVLSGVLGQVCR
jgi:hypothetical protein